MILEAKSITKAYGENVKQLVLKNVNLQIRRGEFVSIMGPSGSGKSTLLYALSGMDKMTEGSVMLDGQEVGKLSEKELSRLRLLKIGFIFQQIHLMKNLSLFDNIVLPAYRAKKMKREKIHNRALGLMTQTGIVELANREITEASGGQLQRVAICRALINQPKILFGDEPTGALNSKAASDIMDILAEINEMGTTILLVTHDVKVAAKTERVLYMVDGSIVGETSLGKYKKEDVENRGREEQILAWLQKMDEEAFCKNT